MKTTKEPSYSRHTNWVNISHLPLNQMKSLIYAAEVISKYGTIHACDVDDDFIKGMKDFNEWVHSGYGEMKFPELYK